jgi:hypothetical protein
VFSGSVAPSGLHSIAFPVPNVSGRETRIELMLGGDPVDRPPSLLLHALIVQRLPRHGPYRIDLGSPRDLPFLMGAWRRAESAGGLDWRETRGRASVRVVSARRGQRLRITATHVGGPEATSGPRFRFNRHDLPGESQSPPGALLVTTVLDVPGPWVRRGINALEVRAAEPEAVPGGVRLESVLVEPVAAPADTPPQPGGDPGAK